MNFIKIFLLLHLFMLNACSTLQWYDSPIPVKVELNKSQQDAEQFNKTHKNVTSK